MPDYDMQWSALGYPKGMGSAKFLPPPDPPFIRVYHLMSTEYAISSIGLRRLKVALFSELNDPFELWALKSHKREIRQRVRGFVDEQNKKTGLLCFSANWTNPMLWSHYAAQHKGICLGFDLIRKEVRDVHYQIERSTPSSPEAIPRPIPTDLQNHLIQTKFIDWKYEQEYRRIVDLTKARKEGNLYFLSFGKGLCLKEVILGVRNENTLEAIRELTAATNPGAVVFKTRLERRGFRIIGDGNYPP